MTTDPELERLLNSLELAVAEYEASGAWNLLKKEAVADAARAALLGYIAAQYVRRDDPRYRILDRANERMVGYTAARGILPWTPGDELPEERIRRMRDGDRQHTLHLDDAGQVVSGAPDCEGER